jgi:hypothetical protein
VEQAVDPETQEREHGGEAVQSYSGPIVRIPVNGSREEKFQSVGAHLARAGKTEE